MKIKKEIQGRPLVINWSVLTQKLILEYDGETVHVYKTWEIALWLLVVSVISVFLGIMMMAVSRFDYVL